MPATKASFANAPGPAESTASIIGRYRQVRQRSEALAAPISPEDAMLQSMPDASPSKWHLAHTTWFFEQFVLGMDPHYVPFDARWHYLFNSYYNSVGPMHARPSRGLLSRPTLAQIIDYRHEVDVRLQKVLERSGLDPCLLDRVVLGIEHEQQHQELLLTDIKHALWCNPLRPAYREDLCIRPVDHAPAMQWINGDEGIAAIGADPWPASALFAFDNESPAHQALLQPHALASRPVTNAEFRAFIDDGGYRNPALWLSAGWALLQAQGWQVPLYWDADCEQMFTLGGMRAIDAHAPVAHLSYFEADAFARWAGARLPTEFEWEHAAKDLTCNGNFVESDALHPLAEDASGDGLHAVALTRDAAPRGLRQMYGDVWEWTSSAYAPYPGFSPLPGALGEYNGKFMCGQQVLRGGSCASPRAHLRASYRNFFLPPDRWQFSGMRLAKDLP